MTKTLDGPFHITIGRPHMTCGFDVGSIDEAIGMLEEKRESALRFIALGKEFEAAEANEAAEAAEPTIATDAPAAAPPAEPAKKRGRPAKEAVAPAPVPVPTAAAPVPPAPAPIDTTLPDFLDRTAAPPPPPAPPPMPVAPSGVLAGKIIAALEVRKAGAPDGGQGLSDWLADPRTGGFVTKGATYDQAIAALRMVPDDKLAQVAASLSVS